MYEKGLKRLHENSGLGVVDPNTQFSCSEFSYKVLREKQLCCLSLIFSIMLHCRTEISDHRTASPFDSTCPQIKTSPALLRPSKKIWLLFLWGYWWLFCRWAGMIRRTTTLQISISTAVSASSVSKSDLWPAQSSHQMFQVQMQLYWQNPH